MDDNDIPPILRPDPSFPNGHSPYPDGVYEPPAPRRSVPLVPGMSESVYAPNRFDRHAIGEVFRRRIAELEEDRGHYKHLLIVWQWISGALGICVVVLFIWLIFHVQIVYGAGGQP